MSQMNKDQPFLYRDKEVAELKYYIENKWPSIIVHGMKGTGKSSLTRFVLDTMKYNRGGMDDKSTNGCDDDGLGPLHYSWINCGEKMTPSQMYKHVLISLKMDPGDPIDWNVIKDCKCHSPTVFVKKLREHYNDLTMSMAGKPQLVIVLDQADILVQSDNSAFVNFIHALPEVVSDTISVTIVMISRLPPLALFNVFYRIHSPLNIFFKSYTFNQTMGILKTLKPMNVTYCDDFYDNYLNLSLRLIFNLTRNLNEIKFIIDANYNRYIEPIKKGDATENEPTKLWRAFEQYLRRSLTNIGLKRHLNSNETVTWNNQLVKTGISYQADSISTAIALSMSSSSNANPLARKSVVSPISPYAVEDIPYTMKFLLVSAYLASYNSKSTDKRFFLKSQAKKYRKSHALNNREEDEDKANGAKYFPLERLIHIYRALLDLNYDFGPPKKKVDNNLDSEDEYDQVIMRCEVRDKNPSQESIMDIDGRAMESSDDENQITSVLATSRMKETTNDFLAQLETLVSLRLVDKMNSTSNQLSSLRKYKISDLVSFDYIEAIAKAIDFDLRQHLEIFMFRK